MNKVIQALAFLALISLSQAVTLQLAAGAQADVSGFGSAVFASVRFQNGNTAATVNIDPYVSFSANINAALSNGQIGVVAGTTGTVGISVTANTTGSGTLIINLGTLVTVLLKSSQFVLISTPVATVGASGDQAVFVPPVTVSGSAEVQYSISFQRNYVLAALSTSTIVGASVANTFQAAFNTTSTVAANTYTTFSASSNSKTTSNTNSGSSTTTANGNAYIQFGNGASGTSSNIQVSQNFFGRTDAGGKTYVAPSGTTTNIGAQYSIVKNSGTFNGNLTYNSNGQGSFTAASAAAYSWYKSASGNAAASGWVKVASTSSVDASGNLQVFAQQSGDFSEWTVAASSASMMTVGLFTISAVIALLF